MIQKNFIDRKVFGNIEDRYFDMLPEHDLSSLITFMTRISKIKQEFSYFIDVGANIGLAALIMQNIVPNCRIACVEPGARSIASLKAMIEANDLGSSISLFEVAASSSRSTLAFEDPINFAAGAAVVREHNERTVTVQAETIDTIVESLGWPRVDMLKIDVEGHEIEVLRGAQRTILVHRPVVFFECNPNALGDRSGLVAFLRDAIDILGAIGRVEPLSGVVKMLPDAEAAADDILALGNQGGYQNLCDLVNTPTI